MIYEETLGLLEENTAPERLAADMERGMGRDLLQALAERFGEEELLAQRDRVRQAVVDFCGEYGKTFVFFRGLEKMAVKVIPARSHPYENEFTPVLLETLKRLEPPRSEGEEAAGSRVISREHAQALLEPLEHAGLPVDKREVALHAVRLFLDLSQDDVACFINGRIFVRYLDSKERSGYERRFNGLPPEELEALAKELYPGGFWPVMEKLLKGLVEGDLDFARISNGFFVANGIRLVQKSIVSEIRKKVDENDFFIEGFANYLLREVFLDIFRFFAARLCRLVLEREKNAEEFLAFYSGGTQVIGGVRYNIPELSDENGNRWNRLSIMSVLAQTDRDRKGLQEAKTAAAGHRAEVDALTAEHGEAVERVASLHKEQQQMEKKIGKFQAELDAMRLQLAEARSAGKSREALLALENKIREKAQEEREAIKEQASLNRSVAEAEGGLKRAETAIGGEKLKLRKAEKRRDAAAQRLRGSEEKEFLILGAVAGALAKRPEKA